MGHETVRLHKRSRKTARNSRGRTASTTPITSTKPFQLSASSGRQATTRCSIGCPRSRLACAIVRTAWSGGGLSEQTRKDRIELSELESVSNTRRTGSQSLFTIHSVSKLVIDPISGFQSFGSGYSNSRHPCTHNSRIDAVERGSNELRVDRTSVRAIDDTCKRKADEPVTPDTSIPSIPSPTLIVNFLTSLMLGNDGDSEGKACRKIDRSKESRVTEVNSILQVDGNEMVSKSGRGDPELNFN